MRNPGPKPSWGFGVATAVTKPFASGMGAGFTASVEVAAGAWAGINVGRPVSCWGALAGASLSCSLATDLFKTTASLDISRDSDSLSMVRARTGTGLR